ncbi:MAG: hypothetical protein AAFN91_08755 [Pseudomonadota bacterium]
MLHASTRKLIDRLAEMTELGKLDWTEDDAGNIAYATEGYSVSLTENPGEVIITSKDGKELERATADEIAASQQEDGTSYTAVVAAMTKEAARIARGTEAAISSLLAGMDDTPNASEIEAVVTDDAETLPEDPIEDPVDDTTVIAADSIETVTEEETSADPVETEEDTTVATTTANTGEEAFTEDEPELESATELEAYNSDEVEETESIEMAAVEPADEDAEVAAIVDEEGSEETLEAESESEVLGDTNTVETPTEATHEEATVEIEPEEDASEALVATDETENDPDAILHAELETDAESVADVLDVESETEVTEAVARMADEVKSREDTGLESAAASAVGAVALAAGLTLQDDEDAVSEETTEAIADESAPDSFAESPDAHVVETAEPPAYVPFGLTEVEEEVLEDDVSAEPDDVLITAAPEIVTEATDVADDVVEIEPKIETTNSPIETLEQLADDTFASRNELDGIESTPVMDEVETESIELIDSAPIDTFVETTESPDADPAKEPDFVSPETDPLELSDPTDAPDAEPELEPVTAAAKTVPASGETYSLSGIGAGFGLGALSARTEASGIPGPSSPSVETGEKVVIDATDDVLPKPEGNLNVSLAETASAAVGSANTMADASGPVEETSETESDILKPRTRFNPWD